MTALGLAVAVPAVLGCNWLVQAQPPRQFAWHQGVLAPTCTHCCCDGDWAQQPMGQCRGPGLTLRHGHRLRQCRTGRFWPGPDDDMLAEINTTPLVDVMLVLLIIF